MNVQALLQSGYLSQTFSTEGGATNEMMETDKSGHPGNTTCKQCHSLERFRRRLDTVYITNHF